MYFSKLKVIKVVIYMEHVCKTLFNILYNNKIFTIFLDENDRRMFLEINQNGEYVYPTLGDFIGLNDKYNNSNPFIEHAINRKFKEKVLVTSVGVLIGVTFVSSLSSFSKHYVIEDKGNIIKVIAENISKKENIEIKDIKQLDDLLGYEEVSLEEIYLAIDSNNKISDEYKSKIHKYVNHLIKKYPNTDLRILYENIKTIEILEKDSNYFEERNMSNVSGLYDIKLNQIVIRETSTDTTLYHELSHVVYSYYRETEDKVIYRITDKGYALGEAMTNVTVSCIKSPSSYFKYGEILEYLCNLVDFNHDIYQQKGMWYLIELLQEKYPTVDIDYIVSSLDVMKQTESNEDFIYLDDSMELLDELFEMCKIELNQIADNYYEPFEKFAKILFYTNEPNSNDATIFYNYLETYNKLLEEKNVNIKIITKEDILEKCNLYENICGIVTFTKSVFPILPNDGTITPSFYEYCFIDENGIMIPVESYLVSNTFSEENAYKLKYYMQITCIENYDIFGTSEYWEKIFVEKDMIDTNSYKKIPIYCDGKLLDNECLKNLYLRIGYNPDGTIGYVVSDLLLLPIYSSSESLSKLSNLVNIYPYFLDTKNLESLDLSTILNQEYLIEAIKKDNKFVNVQVKNEEIYLEQIYYLRVGNDNKFYVCYLQDFYFFEQDGNINMGYKETETSEKTYLKDIMEYYGLLNEEHPDYSYTEEELISLYEQYRNDISLSLKLR